MLLRFSFGLLLLCSSHVLQAALPDFAQIVEERSPAVVKIIAEAKAPVATSRDQMPELEELEQLPEALRRMTHEREQKEKTRADLRLRQR